MMRYCLLVLTLLSPLYAGLKEDAESQILEWSKNPQFFHGAKLQYDYKVWEIPDSLQQKAKIKTKKAFYRDKIEIWRIRDGSNVLAFALLDHTVAKVKPISFLTLFSAQGQVLQSEILKYRESHGEQVTRPKWLAQFKGKKAEDSWIVGKDIDGISGATLSVNSMTLAIQRLAWLAPNFNQAFGTR